MTTNSGISEAFAFWLVREYLDSSDDQTDELQPLADSFVLIVGFVVFVIIVTSRILIAL